MLMTSNNNNCIVWIDTELSGLDIEIDTILEIACIITDKDLHIISEKFNVVINQPDSVFENLNEWCSDVHSKTNLIQESRCSKISLKEAEQMLLDFLSKYIPKGICPLAGNSVSMDLMFLHKFMPLVNNYLQYRIIDVSSIKELVRRWNPIIYENLPQKKMCHRALPDIEESIQELQYYKDKIFLNYNI